MFLFSFLFFNFYFFNLIICVGNLNQPKWGHLEQLHSILKSMEDVLTQGSVRDINYESLVSVSFFFFFFSFKYLKEAIIYNFFLFPFFSIVGHNFQLQRQIKLLLWKCEVRRYNNQLSKHHVYNTSLVCYYPP